MLYYNDRPRWMSAALAMCLNGLESGMLKEAKFVTTVDSILAFREELSSEAMMMRFGEPVRA